MEENRHTRRRFRFSLRTLFVVVTVAAVGSFAAMLLHRHREFNRRAAYHREAIAVKPLYNPLILETVYHHHSRLRAKYERAARYPWLPVEPDPPEPSALATQSLPTTDQDSRDAPLRGATQCLT